MRRAARHEDIDDIDDRSDYSSRNDEAGEPIDVENDEEENDDEPSDAERPRKRARLDEVDEVASGSDVDEDKTLRVAPASDRVGPILYSPGHALPSLAVHKGRVLEVHVLAQHLSFRNAQVQKGVLWGNGQYTPDSDAVAILHHSGNYFLQDEVPQNIYAVRALFRITDGLKEYKGAEEYGLTSYTWRSPCKVSLVVEGVDVMREPSEETLALMGKKDKRKSREDSGDGKVSEEEQRRAQMALISFFPNSLITFTLCNDPCFVYDLALLCDRGVEPERWTSYRFKFAVLYLESLTERYELACEGSADGSDYDTYRLIRVSEPVLLDNKTLEKHGAILHTHLDWRDIRWTKDGPKVVDELYSVRRLFWFPRSHALGPLPTLPPLKPMEAVVPLKPRPPRAPARGGRGTS